MVAIRINKIWLCSSEWVPSALLLAAPHQRLCLPSCCNADYFPHSYQSRNKKSLLTQGFCITHIISTALDGDFRMYGRTVCQFNHLLRKLPYIVGKLSVISMVLGLQSRSIPPPFIACMVMLLPTMAASN